MGGPRSVIVAGFIAAVLAVLTASLLILSFRMRATLIDLNDRTDRAVQIAGEMSAILFGEVNAIVGFQATQERRYSASYQAHKRRLTGRAITLETLMPSLGPTVSTHFKEFQSSISEWHHNVETKKLATQAVPDGEFRRMALDGLLVMRRAQEATNLFNQAVLTYQSTQRHREQRLASLFMALAVIFGPLALSALVLMTHVLRRLNATTSYLESRAHEEEALREVGHSLTGGLSMQDVLGRITEAAALFGQAEDVCIETVDPRRNEMTCVAGRGEAVSAQGTRGTYAGSLAEEVLRGGLPQVVEDIDRESRPDSIFRRLVRRSPNSSAMVIPLILENQPLGAICLIRRSAKRFSYAETPKLRILADMASMALHRARTVEKLQALEKEEHFFAEATAGLASSLDYKRTIRTVAHFAVPWFADVCIVHLVERQRTYPAETVFAHRIAKSIAQQLREKHRVRPNLTISVERVIATRKALLLSEVSDDVIREHAVDEEHLAALRRLDLKSAMVVPMTAGHQTLGALVFFAVGRRRYHADDLERARRITRRAALAIHNVQLYAAANEAIRSRDDILRGVTHDLRSPLSGIQLSAELLRTDSLPDERRQKLLQSITNASKRMNRLVDDLLVISRLRAGQAIPLDLTREDPADLVEQACEMMAQQALQRSVTLRCTRPDTPMPSILVDRTRILQTLTNVLDNSFKFTPPGGEIIVSCTLSAGTITFSVKDSGKGIDPADLDKVFDPFWQARGTAHRGIGLGLAIAKAIVQQHDGRIWIESQLGAGTTVSFAVPVAAAQEEPLKVA